MDKEPVDIRDKFETDLLKADGQRKFLFIKGISPEIGDTISDLMKNLQENPGDIHSTFWLLYLSNFNALAVSIRKQVKSWKDTDEDKLERQKEVFSETLHEDNLLIKRTKDTEIFEGKYADDLLGLMEVFKQNFMRGHKYIGDFEIPILETSSRVEAALEDQHSFSPIPTP